MTVDELHERWEADRDGVQVLDVRERAEWDAGHIPGSVFTPYHDIHGVPGGARPRPRRSRSSAPPASARGRREPAAAPRRADVMHVVDGGVPLWERQGWPTARP